MGRSQAILGHLPQLYREGELVGRFGEIWGVQLDMLDEVAAAVQRAHQFDLTPDFDEAAALAALVGIAPEAFHANIGEFRSWVHAIVEARLQAGSVTREALRILVNTYATGFQAAAGIDLMDPVAAWAAPGAGAALVENPTRLRFARLPAEGSWEPLAQMHVTNSGMDPAPWAVVITGGGTGSEFAPLIANVTTGHAVVFRGQVRQGARLTLAPTAADRGLLGADLDGVDVTDQLDSYAYSSGTRGPGTRMPTNPTPTLARGLNELWFLPLAHFDVPGLDRFLLGFPDAAMRVGRFDEARFEQSLYAMHPEVSAWVAWVEREPASFEIHLPAQALRAKPDGTPAGAAARDRLEAGLDAAVDRAAGVGVATDVHMSRHTERQPSRCHLRGMLPQVHRETGPSGADRLADAGAVFDVTDFDESVLR